MKLLLLKMRFSNWPLSRVLRLLLALLFMAEGIFGEFYLLIPVSLWLGYQVYHKQGCGQQNC